MHGISIVALVWAALVPTHWSRALPTLVLIGLAFPIVMGLGAMTSPAARADWINADAREWWEAHVPELIFDDRASS